MKKFVEATERVLGVVQMWTFSDPSSVIISIYLVKLWFYITLGIMLGSLVMSIAIVYKSYNSKEHSGLKDSGFLLATAALSGYGCEPFGLHENMGRTLIDSKKYI